MTRPLSPTDLEVMEYADGETDDAELAARVEADPDARGRRDAIAELGELVRGELELSADAVPDAKFVAMWRRIDGQLVAPATGLWSRLSAWFDRYRSHIVTGAVSAGAVAALAIVLRPGASEVSAGAHMLEVRPVAQRAAPEIDALDTPGGSSTVISLNDDDGNAAVIWVTPEDSDEEAL